MNRTFLLRAVKKTAMAVMALFILGIIGIAIIVAVDMPPYEVRQYYWLCSEWQRTQRTKPEPNGPDTRAIEHAKLEKQLAMLADRCQNTAMEIAAYKFIARNTRDPELRSHAMDVLRRCFQETDLRKIEDAYYRLNSASVSDFGERLVDRLEKNLDHPSTPFLLARACSEMGSNDESLEPKPAYCRAADLIRDHFAANLRIHAFCESLGGGVVSPFWAERFEPHLQTILKVNNDRWTRCAASLALAGIAKGNPNRQTEAVERYEHFLSDFDGQHLYPFQQCESVYCHEAEQQLNALRFAPISVPAPEIEGVDLDGNQMTLSEYKGSVVMLSFWATWCGPCMKMVALEKQIQEQFQEQGLRVVAVNADEDVEKARQAVVQRAIPWRSFRDKQADQVPISEQWNALFPTVYVIDAQGIVRRRFTGNPPHALLVEAIQKALESNPQ